MPPTGLSGSLNYERRCLKLVDTLGTLDRCCLGVQLAFKRTQDVE